MSRTGVFAPKPPPDYGASKQLNHAAIARELRANPRQWRLVSTHPNRRAALEATARVRHGKRTAYAPAGAFQALPVTTESGVHQVWARYVGPIRST